MAELFFEKIEMGDYNKIKELSDFATNIVREHFNSIIGEKQNEYMIHKFQSEQAITDQINRGYQYYFVYNMQKEKIGFLAFYTRNDEMFLSKFYLEKHSRNNGFSKKMLNFVIDHTRQEGLGKIVLTVNRNNSATFAYEHLGFVKTGEQKCDIGNGFVMDDYVYEYIV
ncbi:acetyltransferase (GNAT) family protein [Lachnotalea glycerini]|uniref:Acetyltransferase (GNAT) family protein n=1 Tax=Lachnotalea glycerini TaxID=1763509 RepID=A0A255IRX5_9FIRM|nr:GNAT family N-acetyltransferase [Lachnotalea glycerini]PXV90329.1 acetyltransferase (GNAT) family protein [Lachnotalea glycerini]RDY29935.1 GNAT family N-acetyltransferase [Lachnotalea glycerini]